MGTHRWHGVAPNAEQTATALAQLEETLGDYWVAHLSEEMMEKKFRRYTDRIFS